MKHTIIPPGDQAAGAILIDLSSREDIEAAVEALLARLDEIDGDPDVERNGDELDGDISEDEFMYHGHDGPGCPVSDPGGDTLDEHGELDESRGLARPVYGIDQTKCPINERQAIRAYKLEQLAR
jgi:hypothetical protein